MVYWAMFSVTRYGPAGFVTSGRNDIELDAWVSTAVCALMRSPEFGLVGYVGCQSFEEAVEKASRWEDAEKSRTNLSVGA